MPSGDYFRRIASFACPNCPIGTPTIDQFANSNICAQSSSTLKEQLNDMKQLKEEGHDAIDEGIEGHEAIELWHMCKGASAPPHVPCDLVARRGGHERPDVRRYSSGGIQGCGVDGRNQVPDMSPLGVALMGSTSQTDSLVRTK
ncbi:hypothetical protein GPALN_014383 [Globodera pallida]|nr:hypothetical protein GPALN_014383 [Globodera pallida]